jgi:hypothetical protein
MKIAVKSITASTGKLGISLGLFLAVACNSGDKKAEMELEKLDWLIGSWQQITEAGTFTETWQQNGSGLSGKGYLIDAGDTIFSEDLKLENRNGEVFYIPIIADQNNGGKVLFKLISSGDKHFVFENKEHDFPQRIIYQQLAGDSLYARVEGEVKGKLKFEAFKMKRIK